MTVFHLGKSILLLFLNQTGGLFSRPDDSLVWATQLVDVDIEKSASWLGTGLEKQVAVQFPRDHPPWHIFGALFGSSRLHALPQCVMSLCDLTGIVESHVLQCAVQVSCHLPSRNSLLESTGRA